MQIELLLILQIVFAHWFSDFVLQSGWMATNKSKNWLALGSHVATYTASLCFTMMTTGALLVPIVYDDAPNAVIYAMTPRAFYLWVAINGVLHFVTDAITSRITSKLWVKGDMHNFFVVVGFDQLIHYTCLFATLIALWTYTI